MSNQHLEEYKIANENIRHYSNLKLAEVTIFVAISGGFFSAAFNTDLGKQYCWRIIIEISALIYSLSFLAILASTQYAIFHFLKRAAELETELNFHLLRKFPGAPKFCYRPSSWASFLIHISVVLFWFGLLLHTVIKNYHST
jgi:hypothetical protein